MSENTFWPAYFNEAKLVIDRIDRAAADALVSHLVGLRARGGRLFILGVGGSAGNASHAVNDFRKLANIEAGGCGFPSRRIARFRTPSRSKKIARFSVPIPISSAVL